MPKIETTKKFDKELEKYANQTQIYKRIQKTFFQIQANLSHHSLRLHKLSGNGFYSISVNKSIRIIAKIDGDTVFLLEIGKHEDVY